MNLSKSASVIIGLILLNAIAVLPANASLMEWAINTAKGKVTGTILNNVSLAVINCAMSTTCIPGQDIRMVTHRIHEKDVFLYVGECFETSNYEMSKNAGQKIAKAISQRSGVPIVFSHVRNDYFIFGVPRG